MKSTNVRARFALKPWRSLPELMFAGVRMRALLTSEDTSALASYFITIPRGRRVPQAYHKKATELIWVMRGGGTARLGSRDLRLRKGDCLVVQPLAAHGFTGGRSGMTLLSILSPRVDAQTDFYPCDEPHAPLKVLSGSFPAGKR